MQVGLDLGCPRLGSWTSLPPSVPPGRSRCLASGRPPFLLASFLMIADLCSPVRFVADSSSVGLMGEGGACFCFSYPAQGDNGWPLELVFHKTGQSSTRRSESQSPVYRQCRSRADWEVRYEGESLVKPRESREGPRHPCNVLCSSHFGCFCSLCVFYNSPNLSCSRGHRAPFPIPSLNKAFMEARA